MTQTTHAGGAGDVVLELSTNDGSTWTDLGGWTSSATFDSWDRVTGSANTVTGEEAIVGFGKLTLTGVQCNYIYSDGDTTDLIDTLWTQHASTVGGGQLMVRYSPQGTSSGKTYIATNTDAKIDKLQLPNFDAASGDPLAGSFHVATSGFDKGTH